MLPTRPDTLVTNIADPLTLESNVTDISAECGDRDAGVPTFWPPFLSSEVTDLTAQYMPPQSSGSVRTWRQLPHLPAAAASDLGSAHHSDTPSRRPTAVVSDSAHLFPRFLPATAGTMTSMPPRPFAVSTHDAMTSTALPRPPVPSRDYVMTSAALPHPLAVPADDVMISALPRPPAVSGHDTLTSPLFTEQPHIHMPLHTFARPLELTGIHSTVTSALSRPPAAPGDDDIIQRPARRVICRLPIIQCSDRRTVLTSVICTQMLNSC